MVCYSRILSQEFKCRVFNQVCEKVIKVSFYSFLSILLHLCSCPSCLIGSHSFPKTVRNTNPNTKEIYPQLNVYFFVLVWHSNIAFLLGSKRLKNW